MKTDTTHSPLVELTLARLREFVREPEALFWTFVFPILMSIAMALAFPGGANKPAIVAIEPGDGAAAMRQTLAAAPGITIRDVRPGDEARALREGEVHLLIVPTDPPAYRFDPARDESRIARLLVDDALKRAAGRVDPFSAREEPVQVAGSRYVDWLIPGIVGMNIMGTSMWGIGFAIVTARGRKLLKRLAASPMRKHEYLLAQIGGRLVFLAPEAGVPLIFGAFVLGMPVRGSIGAIALVSLAGAMAFGGIGLLLASRVRTFEAISGLMNLTMVPMWDPQRDLFLLVELSPGAAADHPGAAADGADQRAARRGARGRGHSRRGARAGGACGVGSGGVRDCAEDFSLEVGKPKSRCKAQTQIVGFALDLDLGIWPFGEL